MVTNFGRTRIFSIWSLKCNKREVCIFFSFKDIEFWKMLKIRSNLKFWYNWTQKCTGRSQKCPNIRIWLKKCIKSFLKAWFLCIFKTKSKFSNFQKFISSKLKKIQSSRLLHFKDHIKNYLDLPKKWQIDYVIKTRTISKSHFFKISLAAPLCNLLTSMLLITGKVPY